MNIFSTIKEFIKRILKINNQKLLESPKVENQILENSIIDKRNNFRELIKVNLNKKEIETLECINDGLGFQKIKNY